MQIRGLQIETGFGYEQASLTDELIDGLVAELGHDFTYLLRQIEKEVDHVLRRALESFTQGFLLRGDTDRARVEMTHARHDAALGYHGDGAEAKLVGSQDSCHDDFPAGTNATVNTELNSLSQLVLLECRVSLGETKLPETASMLHRAHGRCTRAALVTRDLHNISVGLDDATCDGSDAALSNELDGNLSGLVDFVKVVDELGQVLNRIDIVMRRR